MIQLFEGLTPHLKNSKRGEICIVQQAVNEGIEI